MREAVLAAARGRLEAATGPEAKPCDGAWVTELIDQLNLSGWP